MRVLTELRDEGIVQRTGTKASTRYHLTETLDQQTADEAGRSRSDAHRTRRCRETFLARVNAEPDEWTEQRFADETEWHREEVAVICGGLLDVGAVVLSEDGTYRLASRALAA